MSTGITCELYVDDAPVNDGRPGGNPLDPVALSGLSVQWGRDTTVDQPQASTCTFEVLDPPGGGSFASMLSTGRRVAVTATGELWDTGGNGDELWTFLDPNFATGAGGLVTTNAVAHISGGVLSLVPIDPSRRASVILAPGAFVPFPDSPAAWDGIPATNPGQRWGWVARFAAPIGARITFAPVLFSGPWASARTVVSGESLTATGDGRFWNTGSEWTPGVGGRWVGVEVSVFPTGRAWADVPTSELWATFDPSLSWLDLMTTRLQRIDTYGTRPLGDRSVLVFAGRITDVEASYDAGGDAPIVKVTATDFLADLDNRDVGDEPWDIEPMGARFARVLALAGLPIVADIDPGLAPIELAWQDVDNQAATGLLQSFATSVDGVMWSAAHATLGAYLRVEDASMRRALYRLGLDGGLVRVGVGSGVAVSSCSILRDPITFVQNVSDTATRVAITWQETVVDDEGQHSTTEHTVLEIDEPLETELGTRRVGVSTLLAHEADAQKIALRMLARVIETEWRAQGVAIDDEDMSDASLMFAMLDGTSRIGMSLLITDLPEWSPIPNRVGVYVEGGSLHFDDGRWIVEMTISRGRGLGYSVTWAELDLAWRWVDFDPGLSWVDLVGVSGPEVTP